MININGVKFARNASELAGSLFNSSGTASGLYKTKRNGKGTSLYNARGELFAFIVHNTAQGFFVVEAGLNAEGRPFYMHGMSDETQRRLNLPNGCLAVADIIRAAFPS